MLLCGCGFHPGLDGGESRGNTQKARGISFEGIKRYGTFYQTMREVILQQGGRIKQKASTHLTIHQVDVKERTLTIGRDAKQNDILLIMKVRFSWEATKRNKNKSKFGPFSITVQAPYQYDDTARLSNQNQRNRALATLETDVAKRILQHIFLG